ncbi:carcinine hydrolase/isopenicillin-N N-acyltransferase family protein [Kiloniella antarctica]|uniref:Carcinine hydrolase/isopenicillin-N N-acyltransferase family protein n=1 Tax=Kiloniella antarctica TaxID=1550907 RepID=A0ABW5BPY0_9PROT
MCTIGAIFLSKDEYFLFKNKDFSRPDYTDRIKSTDKIWGAEGLETFSADTNVEDIYSGLSIGANKHGLLVADSHVQITSPKASNYDILVETALNQGHDIETALLALNSRISNYPSWWGNLILADRTGTAAVEIRDSNLMVERNPSRITRTNHQHLHGSKDGLENNNSNSYGRYEWITKGLKHAQTLDALKSILASHDTKTAHGAPTGICNHTYSQTVCSYILHAKLGIVTLHSLQGQPCLHSPYSKQTLFAS